MLSAASRARLFFVSLILGFRFASPQALCRRPLRGLLLFDLRILGFRFASPQDHGAEATVLMKSFSVISEAAYWTARVSITVIACARSARVMEACGEKLVPA